MRLICTLFAIVAAGVVAGCTTVKNPDGTASWVLGFDSPEAQAKAAETVKSVSTLLPWPFDAIVATVGGLGVTLIGAYAAKKKGEEKGWDLAHAESPALGGTPAPAAPPAPTPPTT